ncbi:MAG: hypothetical protein SPI25_02025 [Dialister sp.]|nr:hypothetical protein [Dialister sp.]
MTPEREERIHQSPHYVNGEFVLDKPHEPIRPGTGFSRNFYSHPGKNHSKGADHHGEDRFEIVGSEEFLCLDGPLLFLYATGRQKILIDSVFSNYAVPVPFIPRASFPITTANILWPFTIRTSRCGK